MKYPKFYYILAAWWTFIAAWVAPWLYTGNPFWLFWPFFALVGLLILVGVPLFIWFNIPNP